MNIKCLVAVFILFQSIGLTGQSFRLEVTVLDATTNKPLEFASVQVMGMSDALQLTLNLRPAAQILNSVTVTTNDARTRLERAVMGVERLNIEAIKVLPVAYSMMLRFSHLLICLVCFRFLRQMLFDP